MAAGGASCRCSPPPPPPRGYRPSRRFAPSSPLLLLLGALVVSVGRGLAFTAITAATMTPGGRSTPSASSSSGGAATAASALHAIVPKEETNALRFVRDNPTYDGRGVTIGVLDTGVDPGAIGLGGLPPGAEAGADDADAGGSGGPKVVNIVDCTGSGDVDVTTEVDAVFVEGKGEGGDNVGYWEVKGLTGRTLRLNPNWNIRPFPVGLPAATVNETTTSEDEPKSTPTDKEGEKAGADEVPSKGEEEKDSVEQKSKENQDSAKEGGDVRKVRVRLGIKRGYELFPGPLVRRIKAHRKKSFDEEQRRHAAVVRGELERWRAGHPDPKNVTHEQVRVREDLEARLEFLEPSSGGGGNGDGGKAITSEDPGPMYDCVVYHDGTNYRAAIDVNEDGDLTEAESLTDFDKEPTRYGTFGHVDQYNYGVHVYDDGRTLSIVCDAGAHGSHVAGIAAAFHGPTGDDGDDGDVESGNINGVAPGARVISLKVGDTRLGSMETGTALTRALIEAVRLKCDVINLSYGEASALPDSGRFVRLAEDAVQRHGVFFVSSAGNNGPAISTVGSPGGTSSSVLSVAAYISPAMMEVGYSLITNPRWANVEDADAADDDGSTKGATPVNAEAGGISDVDVGSSSVLRDALTGSTYTWSSVGPSTDGDQGVHVCAPGGAITCVPNWTLQRKRLMNGTSMSSPHVAGCVALLLSAAKAAGIAINPNRVRRAIQNTAKQMDGLSNLEQGYGMIQVDRAWEYLVAHRDDPKEDVCFKVCIDNRAGRPRGVYLRQPDEVSARQTLSVNVDPQFRKDDVDPETQRLRVEFEMHVKLVSTAPSWIRTPDHLVLVHNGRSFKIEVDPTDLPHGIHTAHVHGYDSDKPGGGPMFSVPITAIKSLDRAVNIPLGKLQFKPAEVKRHFLDVPHGATWMDVSVKDCRSGGGGGTSSSSAVDNNRDASPRLVVLHTLQLLPHQPYSRAEKERYLNLLPGQLTVTSVPVHAGVVCELALARYWSAIGETAVEVEVNFRGIRPVPETIHMASGGGGGQVRLVCDLQDETIQPSAKLSKWLTPLRPKSSGSVSSLGERDVLPSENRRIYQMVLTYEFAQEEDGAFTPRVPSLQGYLYESAYESQLLMIYDGEKKKLGETDAYPGEVKVPKGTVTLRLQVRHDDPDMLNKLKDQIIWIERKLGKDISLSIYDSHASMVSGSDTFQKRSLRKGNSLAVFVAEPASSKLPKGYKCGDVLEGSVSYGSGDGNLPGQGKKPGGFAVRYTVGPTDSSKDSSKGNNGVTPELPDERSEAEKLEEAVAKLRVEKLEKLSADDKDDEKFQELYNQILGTSNDDNLPLCMVGLKHHDQERWREKRLSEIIEAADRVIKAIDENELVLHYGVTGFFDKEDAKACKERKEMDEKKEALIEAFARKARALSDIDAKEKVKDFDGSSFDDTLKQLRKWVDIDANSKYAVLTLERERRAGRPGAVLKLLNKLLENNGDDTKGGICKLSKPDILQRRAAVFEELGFKHLVDYDTMWRLISSPKDYAPF